MPDKLDRCVKKVTPKEGTSAAFAICTAALRKKGTKEKTNKEVEASDKSLNINTLPLTVDSEAFLEGYLDKQAAPMGLLEKLLLGGAAGMGLYAARKPIARGIGKGVGAIMETDPVKKATSSFLQSEPGQAVIRSFISNPRNAPAVGQAVGGMVKDKATDMWEKMKDFYRENPTASHIMIAAPVLLALHKLTQRRREPRRELGRYYA